MIIGISGLPASGKTKMRRELRKQLIQHGVKVRIGFDLEQFPMGKPKGSRFLYDTPERLFSYRLAKFRFENAEFMGFVDDLFKRDFVGYNLFCELIARHIIASDEMDPNVAVIFDEGFLHRLVRIFAHVLMRNVDLDDPKQLPKAEQEKFSRLIELMPSSRLEIILDVDPTLTIERRLKRVEAREETLDEERKLELEQRFNRKFGDLDILELQYRLFNIAVDVLSQNKRAAIFVADASDRSIHAIKEALKIN